jgi:hypothetical protein
MDLYDDLLQHEHEIYPGNQSWKWKLRHSGTDVHPVCPVHVILISMCFISAVIYLLH